MSHHGSKANIRKKLLEMIDCDKYLFTTNGGTAGAYHPDRQTLACVSQWKHNDITSIKTIILNFLYLMERTSMIQ